MPDDPLHESVGAVWLDRDVVRVAGPDAATFLQGQLSQDIAELAAGASALSWVLQPQGKVDALLRVTRTDPDTFLLDTDGGWGERVVARLARFKLRTKADIEALPWRCLALRGPGAGAVTDEATVVVPGMPDGVDVLGPAPEVPDGVPVCDIDAWEALRIEAGIPRMGAELDERTIPAEVGPELIAATVSFAKGCFTGQELVARIDSRGGHVPRRLRGVVVGTDADAVPPLGAVLRVGERDVGALTSVVRSARRRLPVGLAFVRRDVEPPAEVELIWPGGGAMAMVEALPLLS